jgi:tetratricopeptide (TPR) repeat protein
LKKEQLIVLAAGLLLVSSLYFFGRTVAGKKTDAESAIAPSASGAISFDTILLHSKENLTPDQKTRLANLEKSLETENDAGKKLQVLHQLAHFWSDTARVFLPYARYQAEAARLDNSEKNLTFAAHLFLDDVKGGSSPALKKWGALQAKDLFERSLKINPENDSAKIGLGACYVFGEIDPQPMTGINIIREVLAKDSTNIYALMTLASGSLLSGQYEKAIGRFESILKIEPANIEAGLLLAETYERTENKEAAVKMYKKCMALVKREDIKAEIQKRIDGLEKQRN